MSDKRLVDHFFQCGYKRDVKLSEQRCFLVNDEESNKNLDLPDEGNPFNWCFKPRILCQYPLDGQNGKSSLAEHVSMFCFPRGITYVHTKNGQTPLTKFHSFILTDNCGTRSYGFVVTIYDHIPKEQFDEIKQEYENYAKAHSADSEEISANNVYVPRCVGLISSWNWHDLFISWLLELTLMFKGDFFPAAFLERYVVNIVDEIPLPPLYSETIISLNRRNLYFSFPHPLTIQRLKNFSFYPIFRCLGVSNIVTIFELILLERKILFVSKTLDMLSQATNTFMSLIYPFTWCYVLISVLPRSLLSYLGAPFPFIIGIERHCVLESILNDKKALPDVCVVDLDNNVLVLKEPCVHLPDTHRNKVINHLKNSIPRFLHGTEDSTSAKISQSFKMPGAPKCYLGLDSGRIFCNSALESKFRQKAPVSEDLKQRLRTPIVAQYRKQSLCSLGKGYNYNDEFTKPLSEKKRPERSSISCLQCDDNFKRTQSKISSSSELQSNHNYDNNHLVECAKSTDTGVVFKNEKISLKTISTDLGSQIKQMRKNSRPISQRERYFDSLSESRTQEQSPKGALKSMFINSEGHDLIPLTSNTCHCNTNYERSQTNYERSQTGSTRKDTGRQSGLDYDFEMSSNTTKGIGEFGKFLVAKNLDLISEIRMCANPDILDDEEKSSVLEVKSKNFCGYENCYTVSSSAPRQMEHEDHGAKDIFCMVCKESCCHYSDVQSYFVSDFQLKTLDYEESYPGAREPLTWYCTYCSSYFHTSCAKYLDEFPCPVHFEESKVQGAMLWIMLEMLKTYKSFLIPYRKVFKKSEVPNRAIKFSECFKRFQFEESVPKQLKPFVRRLVITQAFSTFITMRANPAANEEDICFFDKLIRLSSEKQINEKNISSMIDRVPSSEECSNIHPVVALTVNQENMEKYEQLRADDIGLPDKIIDSRLSTPRPITFKITDRDIEYVCNEGLRRRRHSKTEPQLFKSKFSLFAKSALSGAYAPGTLRKSSDSSPCSMLDQVERTLEKYSSIEVSALPLQTLEKYFNELCKQNELIIQIADQELIDCENEDTELKSVVMKLSNLIAFYQDQLFLVKSDC